MESLKRDWCETYIFTRRPVLAARSLQTVSRMEIFMFSYIRGELVEILKDAIVIETNLIGYHISMPLSTIDALSGIGQQIKIYTYLYVKEDAMVLYGFLTKDDLQIFKLLIGVSGIGPKGALALLSVLTPDDLRFAVIAEDSKTISKAPGIGIKTAKRVILELKDKLSLIDAFMEEAGYDPGALSANSLKNVKSEAIQALVALGYSSGEAAKVLNGIEITEEMTVEELLKAALKNIAF